MTRATAMFAIAFWLLGAGSALVHANDKSWVVKNNKGQVVQRVKDTQYHVEYRNKKGFLEGWFDKRTNTMRDKRGFPVGTVKPGN